MNPHFAAHGKHPSGTLKHSTHGRFLAVRGVKVSSVLMLHSSLLASSKGEARRLTALPPGCCLRRSGGGGVEFTL